MKKTVGVIFGGVSNEHQVSIISGTSIISNLDKNKYTIIPIYIKEDGIWYQYKEKINKIHMLKIEEKPNKLIKIKNPINFIKNIDIIFPVLHGKNGEDGTIQGMLEILNKKYIGCRVLASSLCMDKVYTKMILSKANINIAKYIYIRKKNNKYYYYNNNLEENIITNEKIINLVNKSLKFPVFVKPSNSGSSVGITKVDKKEELIEALNFASKYDDKILIEECIIGRELECAILEENENKLKASIIGEVVTPNKFYSFDEKYKSPTTNTIIPARIPANKQKEIQKIAIKAFKLMDCKDIARIDFFLEEKTGKVILNEINTMPGFTQISMYPKLWENTNITYQELLDKLINQD